MNELCWTLETINEEKNSIFLAGPTRRIVGDGNYNKPSWRDSAVEILRDRRFDGIIYIPEWKNGLKPKSWTYSRQVDWEMKAMSSAGSILFWIPRNLRELIALTTNIEFGEYMKSGKIVCGAPYKAPKNQYIKERCSRLKIPWSGKLDECVDSALQKLSELKGESGKTWFTSDTHFGDQRTLELFKRPFNSVEEMDWEIVKRWNSVVGEKDMVFHLGDFGNPEKINHLNFDKVILLAGNYDTKDRMDILTIHPDVYEIKSGGEFNLQGDDVSLFHEPTKGEGCLNFFLFGHIHKLQMVKRNGLNVGVDCHNFTPIDMETVSFYRNAILNHYDENVFC